MAIMLTIGAFLFQPKVMTFFLVFLLAFAFADLFKRHLLSNAVVYTATMLVIPIAALTAVGTPIAALINDVTVVKEILLIIESIALLAVCLTVYIRGHISPVDKTLEKYSGGIRFYAARRLISVGIAGNLLYGLLFIAVAVETSTIAGGLLLPPEMTVSEFLFMPIFYLLLLCVPILNILVILMFIVVGAEFVALGATALMTLIPILLIANGCIRYILTTDMTKGKKALWIFLSFIPVFNFIYGIICLTKINKRLKETQFS